MNIVEIFNHFFGFRSKATGTTSSISDASVLGRPVSDELIRTPAAGRILVLFMGSQFAAELARKVSDLGSNATLSGIAFKAYDNWKHQHNEITDIAAEVDFHEYGLKRSGIQQPVFESSMIKAMIKSAKLDRHLDAGAQRQISASLESMLVDHNDDCLIKNFVNNISIHEFSSDCLSLELKIEIYLAASLVAMPDCKPETASLRALANEMQIPETLINQLQFQLPKSLPQAA